jgi:pantothenate synthetase
MFTKASRERLFPDLAKKSFVCQAVAQVQRDGVTGSTHINWDQGNFARSSRNKVESDNERPQAAWLASRLTREGEAQKKIAKNIFALALSIMERKKK